MVGVLAGVEGDGDLTACVRVALVVTHAAQRRRNFARVGAVVLAREGDRHRRRAAPRAVLACVESFFAQGVRDEIARLPILPLGLARCVTAGDRGGVDHTVMSATSVVRVEGCVGVYESDA